VIFAAILATIVFGSSEGQSSSYEQFQREFTAGADCPRLFQLRNEAKVRATAMQAQEMNEKLRSVRCFSATSKRAATTTGDGGFTVKEYRIYRAIIGSPMSVPERQAVRNAAKKYGVTEAAAKKAADKVMDMLMRNRWNATPEAEIRHASDWKGEKK